MAKDPPRRSELLLIAGERKLFAAFVETVSGLETAVALQRLERLLESGQLAEALELGRRRWGSFADQWTEVAAGAGSSTARFVSRQLGALYGFERFEGRALEALTANRLRLVRELAAEQRQASFQAIAESLREGMNPRQTARAFRASLGLTARQEAAVRNFRRMLEAGDPEALTRKLRDRRFDGSILRAIRGEQLDRSTIERMVTRYRERYIALRATTIARTEALRAISEGVGLGYEQGVEAGIVEPTSLIDIWNTTGDRRRRDSHRAMQGQERPHGSPFTTGAGYSIRFPGDLQAPASETINCRCILSRRFAASSIFPMSAA